MKFVAVLALAVAAVSAVPAAWAGPDVGVSIGIHQPGVYGRIDIGGRPPPPVVYPQPILVTPGPVAVHRRPVYMYVPPGYQRDWRHHCYRYGACGQPVYFVRESWVRDQWRPAPPRSHWDRHDDRRWDRHDGRRWDRGRWDDRGHDRGRRGHRDD